MLGGFLTEFASLHCGACPRLYGIFRRDELEHLVSHDGVQCLEIAWGDVVAFCVERYLLLHGDVILAVHLDHWDAAFVDRRRLAGQWLGHRKPRPSPSWWQNAANGGARPPP